MIKSFADSLTEEIFNGIHSHAVHKKFSSEVLKKIERKLDLLNAVDEIEHLKVIPSHLPEGVVRDVHGKYSIPIETGWRLLFRWDHEDCMDVELKS